MGNIACRKHEFTPNLRETPCRGRAETVAVQINDYIFLQKDRIVNSLMPRCDGVQPNLIAAVKLRSVACPARYRLHQRQLPPPPVSIGSSVRAPHSDQEPS